MFFRPNARQSLPFGRGVYPLKLIRYTLAEGIASTFTGTHGQSLTNLPAALWKTQVPVASRATTASPTPASRSPDARQRSFAAEDRPLLKFVAMKSAQELHAAPPKAATLGRVHSEKFGR